MNGLAFIVNFVFLCASLFYNTNMFLKLLFGKVFISLLLICICILAKANASVPCASKDFGEGSVVCVCNVSYCDTLDPLTERVEMGKFYEVFSDKNGKRFAISEGSMKHDAPDKSNETVTIKINRNKTFQKIMGFGGAFTDATGINILTLDEVLQETLIRQYFDQNMGINYTIGRVPMAGTDFSTHTYSYNDVENDPDLEHFQLQDEDLNLKIPFIKKARELQPSLKLIAAPWSAPKWMKTNNEFYGKGSLKPEYFQTWANYFKKFLDSYSNYGLEFWSISAQNEPTDGNIPGFSFNCMGWTAEEQRDWIKNFLGPTIANSNHSNVNIIMLDDQRIHLQSWTRKILLDEEAEKYIAGIGLHWYVDALVSASVLEKAHEEFPHKFMLATEACAGALPLETAVVLGSWERAEMYASDIISDLNHWVTGWIDWNMALSITGGPNWANNEVDSPIIVDSASNSFYKQPMFYAMGHFSAFIPENSFRILRESDDFKGLSVLTCLRPDGQVAVVVLNMMEREVPVLLNDTESGYIEFNATANSIYTIIYA